MKYSCCLYPKGTETLAEAEVAMLNSYVEKAELKDGMSILDLGYVQEAASVLYNCFYEHPCMLISTYWLTGTSSCGWGSCALYFSEIFPGSKITAISNSRTQKEYIDSKAKELGLTNLNVITGNIVDYEFESESFDRVVSIEVT